jgi:hypothetical protein
VKPFLLENRMNEGTMELLPVQHEQVTHLPAQQQAAAGTPLALMQYAMANGGANLDQLERLMSMQRDYEANEARKAYVDAMAQFKMNPPEIIKDKKVEYVGTKFNHATLGAVTEAIVAGLARHGFTHRWIPQQDGATITVTCEITHKLGHKESVSMSSGKDDSGKKNQIQQIASAITYLQRYTLLAATGVATKEQGDDDGNGYSTDTSVADEWIEKLAAAATDADCVALWQPATKALAKDKLGFKEFEAAFIERRTALAGEVK